GSLPLAVEHPCTDEDDEQRPVSVEAVLPESHGVKKEKNAETDEDDGADRNLAGFDFLSCSKRLRQAQWIRHRLAHLDGLGRPHRVDDLIDIEKCDADAKQRVPASGVICPEDEQREDQQMRKSLGILRAVDRTHSEGKKSSENSGYGRVRA